MRGLFRVATWRTGVRNAVALLVSVASTLVLLGALASAGTAGSGLSPSDRGSLIVEAALLGLAGGAILWLAVHIAATQHVLYPPFLLLALASFRWFAFPWQRWPIGVGMLVIGLVAGIATHLRLRARIAAPGNIPQA